MFMTKDSEIASTPKSISTHIATLEPHETFASICQNEHQNEVTNNKRETGLAVMIDGLEPSYLGSNPRSPINNRQNKGNCADGVVAITRGFQPFNTGSTPVRRIDVQ